MPRGHSRTVALALQRERVLSPGRPEAVLFAVLSHLSGRGAPLRAGEFRFPAHVSMLGALAILRHARPVQHELTIPEGLTAAQISGLIDRAGALSGGFDPPFEGAVLPETYAYELGTPRSALLDRMRAAMTRALDRAWSGRASGLPLAAPRDLLILASIVERETALPAERPLVAEVFINRLRAGMKLQSDPTVAYGAAGGLGSLPRPLTRADLSWPNPYNTYLIPALPPGPISAPGQASIDAVAHPAGGDLLYFVANGSGGHSFSASLPEHLRNVQQLRAVEAARPGQTPTLDPLRPPPQTTLRPPPRR